MNQQLERDIKIDIIEGKYKEKTMSKEMRKQIDKIMNWKQFLNEDINESEFGFGEFPKPKTETWIQLMNRARKDGLLLDLHYGDKRIQNIAKEVADEFKKMEEPNKTFICR